MHNLRTALVHLCLLMTLLSMPGVILGQSEPTGPINRAKPVGELIDADGRFDLDLIRESNYQGNLNLDGMEITIDPLTGAPIVRPAASSSPTDHPDDIYWDNSIAPCIAGVVSCSGGFTCGINAMVVYNGSLVVAGDFYTAGCSSVNNIAMWNGEYWSPLGSGLDHTVFALTLYDGNLIAGGCSTRPAAWRRALSPPGMGAVGRRWGRESAEVYTL